MGRLESAVGSVRMATPLVALSGVFGIEHLNLTEGLPGVGSVVTKSVTLKPRQGNPVPRIIPTPAGLLNSIGLQNPGVEKFIATEIPKLRVLHVPIIVSVAGSTIAEYVMCTQLLAERDEIDAIELNVSCPNVEEGGMEFGCDPMTLEALVSEVNKAAQNKTLIVKLTPNVTDITDSARAAIAGGADAISLINTLRGMAIDLHTRKPKLGNRYGGLSGRAIHPVAVYMVYRCYTACCKDKIPIIGMGGVSTGEDALELILAGASCVGIGTAMFRDPKVFRGIEEYLRRYLDENGLTDIRELIGKAAEI